MSLQDENKKLKEKLQELQWIKEFQQDVIIEFERVTGREPVSYTHLDVYKRQLQIFS